jgi:FSR family fosmidomycin resistance protein-like MFS transporter
VSAGAIFSLFIVSGTVSGLVSGHLSDKIGYRPIFMVSHILMAPVLLLFLNLEGGWIYLGAVLAGAVVLASLPLGVSMAQVLAPKGRSMVASLMMGFAFGLGGAMSPLVGKLADIFSIYTVLTWLCLVPLLSVPFIWRFPRVGEK